MTRKEESQNKRKDERWDVCNTNGQEPTKQSRCGGHCGKKRDDGRGKIRGALRIPLGTAVHLPRQFRNCCEVFLREKKLSVKEATLTKYVQMIGRHILPFFEKISPVDIGTDEVLRFTEQLHKEGLSAKTVRDILTLLRQIICFTYERMSVDAPKMKYLFPKERKKEIRVLSVEEQRLFVDYLRKKPDRFSAGILLALYTGMRIGEICALREEDISLPEGVIRVRQTVQRIRDFGDGNKRTKVLFDSPKSDSSVRLIPLTEKAAKLCSDWMSGNPRAFFLTGWTDEWVEPRLLQYHFGKCARECGLTDLHFHVLRHTFATRCVEVGVEIKSLSEILGHSSPRVTLERYVHSSLLLKKKVWRNFPPSECKETARVFRHKAEG